jgi:hypothetical protein
MTNDFDPDLLTKNQIDKLRHALPCAKDAIIINDHETRIKMLEELNIKLGIVIYGNEAQPSIFSRLDSIEKRLKTLEDYLLQRSHDIDELSDAVQQSKLQRLFNSATWKIFLVGFGAASGFLAKWIWITFLV